MRINMDKTIYPAWSDLEASRFGRTFFLTHLLVWMFMVGYVWNYPGYRPPYPLFNRIFEFLWYLDSGYLERFDYLRLYCFGPKSRFSDAMLALFVSVPWWVYGFSIEYTAVKRQVLIKHFDSLLRPP